MSIAMTLAEHEAQEVAAELRAERVQARVKDMLENEYSPWTYLHFQEALGEISNTDLICIYAGLASAIQDLKLNNNSANQTALIFIKKAVEDYWRNLATIEAERLEDYRK